MEPFVIFLCIGLSIFVITSVVVVIRRRQEKKRYPGQVFGAPVAVTSAPGVYPGIQMPVSSNTTTYQIDVYATPYPQQGSPAQTAWPQQPPPSFQPYTAPYHPVSSTATVNSPTYNTAVTETQLGQTSTTTSEIPAPNS